MKSSSWPFVVTASLALSAVFPVWGQVLQQQASLAASPGGDLVVGSVKKGTPVVVLERDGFWIRVKAGSVTGWTRISTVSFSARAPGSVRIDTGRASVGNIVSTSAARGMSRVDLASSNPAPDAVRRIIDWKSSEMNLGEFRKEGGLLQRSVDFLRPAPVSAETDAGD